LAWFSFLATKKNPLCYQDFLSWLFFPILLSTKKSLIAFNFFDLMITKPLSSRNLFSVFMGAVAFNGMDLKLVAKRFCPTLCIALSSLLAGFELSAWRSLALWFGKAVRSRSELASLGVALGFPA
jgi:hypothetical protein